MNVAKSVRLKKEAHPENYCADRKCLWNLRSAPCSRHPRVPPPTKPTSAGELKAAA